MAIQPDNFHCPDSDGASPRGQAATGEGIAFSMQQNDMRLMARLTPPQEGGPLLTLPEVVERARQAGAVFGLDDEGIGLMLSQRDYTKSYPVAQGRPPVEGSHGKLIYHFRTQLTGAPRELEGGRVDFHSLDIFEPVTQGQLLVTVVPAQPGQPGCTVRGKELPAPKVRPAPAVKGRNLTSSPEGDRYFAAVGGMATLVGGKVNVSNSYHLDGSCDMGTGNIDFDGNVFIKGGVINNMVVRATGSITIGGVVEGSEIYAGDNVELKIGMQGMDRGRIIAGGMVRANYLERCTVIAAGSIYADVILHSNIECGEKLVAAGKRGGITGGMCRVGQEVSALTLGAASGVLTVIEVGAVPQTRQRIAFLTRDIERLEEEIEKLDKLVSYLSQGRLDDARQKLYDSVQESRKQDISHLQENKEELSVLQQQVDRATAGKIHVKDTAYPGARLSISSAKLQLREPIPYATFLYRDGEITFGPYEG